MLPLPTPLDPSVCVNAAQNRVLCLNLYLGPVHTPYTYFICAEFNATIKYGESSASQSN